MNVNFQIYIVDKMMGYNKLIVGELEAISIEDAERKVRQLAAAEVRQANYEADMDDRYEIADGSLEVKFR